MRGISYRIGLAPALAVPATASAAPADIAAAVADTAARAPDNVKLDEGRMPAEVLTFFLPNSAEDHSLLVFDQKIRGKTNRFMFRSRKPQ